MACTIDQGFSNYEPLEDRPDAEYTGPPPIDTGYLTVRACPRDPVVEDTVATNESCEVFPVYGDMDPQVEWRVDSFANYGEYDQILMAPMVGQLTDDDGDGDIDRYDIPDIVVVSDDGGAASHRKGILRILSGDGSTQHLNQQRGDYGDTQVYPYRYTNVALGDIDQDGTPEIVLMVQVVSGGGSGSGTDDGGEDTASDGTGGDGGSGDDSDNPVKPMLPDGEEDGGSGGVASAVQECRIAAFTPTGGVDWISDTELECGGHAPSIADLDADGDVEVIIGALILDGASGARVAEGNGGTGRYYAYAEIGFHSVVSDLDGDGQQEVIAGGTIYTATGGIRCGSTAAENDGFVGVADLDADGEGEALVVGNGQARVMQADCGEGPSWTLLGGGNGGPPTIADFDADLQPEIGIADATTYTVYEPDGTVLWSRPVADASSHATGSAVFDFEGDGRPEVVYADEEQVWVFGGIDGEVRMQDTSHGSRTLHEFPTVVDVDGDGQAEIVVPNGGGHDGSHAGGLYVLGSASNSWLAGRQVWNQHAYNITNINDDLSVPSPPDSNWPLHNNFRSGDPHPVSGDGSGDAVPTAELCMDECRDGHAIAYARVGNSGAAPIRAGVPVSLYVHGADGSKTHTATEWTLHPVQPGETSDLLTFTLPMTGLLEANLVIEVDDDNHVQYVNECVETNNSVSLPVPTCP